MIPGSAPHIWENNLESDKRRDTALLLELLCLCAKKKEPLAALFCSASDPQPSAKRDITASPLRDDGISVYIAYPRLPPFPHKILEKCLMLHLHLDIFLSACYHIRVVPRGTNNFFRETSYV